MIKIGSGFRIKNGSTRQQNISWDMTNYRYDMKRGNRSGAAWALQRARYNRRRR